MSRPEQYDLVVVGGGMVGASLLCALLPAIRRFGLRIAIVEAFPLYRQSQHDGSGKQAHYQPSYDARSTALSWGSCNILKQLGLWTTMSERATPIQHIHVSDRGHFGAVRMNAQDYGIDALGYVVENTWLGQVLQQPFKENGALSFLCPATVTAIETSVAESSLEIEIEGEKRTIQTGLVVVADGGRSQLCQQLNIEIEQFDYHQHAIIANLSAQQPHQHVAYERFTEAGPLALLPLDEPDKRATDQTRSAMVFTVPEGNVEDLMALPDSDFLAVVQEKFGYRLGRFKRIGERHSYPLRLQKARDQVRPGVVVMGNAAHTLHPVAGQGFNLALRGVADLASCIHQGCVNGESLGSIALLQTYLGQRDADQQRTIGFSDKMIRLFSNNNLLLSQVRDLGLVALDSIPVAKKLFAQQAMGFSRSMPPVSRAGQ